MSDYVCALSGLEAKDEDLIPEPPEDDELDDMPIGWTRVTFDRRVANPKYIALHQVMESMVDQAMTKIPDAQKEIARPLVEIQVEAQFSGLIATTGPFITETDTVYLAPPEIDSQVKEAISKLKQSLGISPDDEPDTEKE